MVGRQGTLQMKAMNVVRLFSRRRPNEVSRVQSKQNQSQVGDYTSTILDILNDRAPSSEAAAPSSAAGSESVGDASAASSVVVPPPPTVSLETVAHAVEKLKGVEATRVTDLQAMLGMGFAEFGGLITNLNQLGLVKISGDPGLETIALTPQGEFLSQMF